MSTSNTYQLAINRLEAFHKAYSELLEFWYGPDGQLIDQALDKYPFEESLEDYNVQAFVNTTVANIKKLESVNYLETGDLPKEKSLKERMQEALAIPDDEFGNYATDLLVIYTPDRYKWLQDNYEFVQNAMVYTSDIPGQPWFGKKMIDIPFAHNVK